MRKSGKAWSAVAVVAVAAAFAVPAAQADAYQPGGSTWSSLRPHDAYQPGSASWNSVRPHDAFQPGGSSWSSVRPHDAFRVVRPGRVHADPFLHGMSAPSSIGY